MQNKDRTLPGKCRSASAIGRGTENVCGFYLSLTEADPHKTDIRAFIKVKRIKYFHMRASRPFAA